MGHSDRDRAPGWTYGLRQLYDAVLEDSVPKDLNNLLVRLKANTPQQK